jgi:hypothetical protein
MAISLDTSGMGIMSLIGMLFGADAAAPPDAMRLDGTTETTLARSLSALLPDERGWITFAEARILNATTQLALLSQFPTRGVRARMVKVFGRLFCLRELTKSHASAE